MEWDNCVTRKYEGEKRVGTRSSDDRRGSRRSRVGGAIRGTMRMMSGRGRSENNIRELRNLRNTNEFILY